MTQKNGSIDYGSIQKDNSSRGRISQSSLLSSSVRSESESVFRYRHHQPQAAAWWNRYPALAPAVSFAFLILVGTLVATIRSGSSSSGSSTDLFLASMATVRLETAKTEHIITPAIAPLVNNSGRSYSSTQRFYTEQRVDHFDPDHTETWAHRYYAKKKYWRGPGHPIFLVVGGEGANEIGFFYDFIEKVLAKQFGAYSLHPEHRFYGPFRPVENATAEQLAQLLTPEQAMMDMIQVRI